MLHRNEIINRHGKPIYLFSKSNEGGQAYESDWDYVDEFKSFDLAFKYITDTYGEVEKIAVY